MIKPFRRVAAVRVGRRLVAVPVAVARGSRARTYCLVLVEVIDAGDVWDPASFTGGWRGRAAQPSLRVVEWMVGLFVFASF